MTTRVDGRILSLSRWSPRHPQPSGGVELEKCSPQQKNFEPVLEESSHVFKTTYPQEAKKRRHNSSLSTISDLLISFSDGSLDPRRKSVHSEIQRSRDPERERESIW